jgi:FkbM family methyltransferase
VGVHGSLRRVIKRMVAISPFDVRLKHDSNTMVGAVRRLRLHGLEPRTVVDVGAASGDWAAMCMREFPSADYLLVEMNPCHASRLEDVARKHPNAKVCMCAASEADGQVRFERGVDAYGGAVTARDDGVAVASRRLDSLMLEHRAAGPMLVKLDVHGYEDPVIRGLGARLADVVALIVESYNFRLAEGSKSFWEMCGAMERLGFKVFDVVDIMLRPQDHVFWQFDLVFVRDTDAVFQQRSYRCSPA